MTRLGIIPLSHFLTFSLSLFLFVTKLLTYTIVGISHSVISMKNDLG